MTVSDRYRVHRLDLRMTQDQDKLEHFLNGLRGEVISVLPNVTPGFMGMSRIDFVLVIERLPE